MLKYILRRLLVLVPTLLGILLITFLISRNTPGDSVYLEMEGQFREGSAVSPELRDKEYARISHQKGLDLPMFYLSLTSLAYPADLHKVLVKSDRENLARMVDNFGDWSQILAYYEQLRGAIHHALRLKVPAEQLTQSQEMTQMLQELKVVATKEEIQFRLGAVEAILRDVPLLQDSMGAELLAVQQAFGEVEAHTSTWKLYIPYLHFHGLQNQFHVWLYQLFSLDLGRSYIDHQKVTTKIVDAMPWTVFMGFFSFAISYMVAIPAGVYSVRNRNQWQDRGVTIFLFMLNAVPSFVAAMIVMTFLCNPEYLQLFPTNSVNSDGAENWPLMYRLLDYLHHLTLPTLIFSYGSITFISRQLRGSMVEVMHADFIRTARAKGLSEETVIWRHTLRNSILPIITHFAHLFPLMVGGALITESIFSIPGMGLLTLNALSQYDHPVVMAVLTLTTLATLVGYFVSDILYALADPRISFSKP